MASKQYRQIRFETPPGATELLLVRHGESAVFIPGEEVPRLDGHSDPELAPEGRVQARRVASRLAKEQIDAIYVTPLRRTAQTAQPLAEQLALTPVVAPGLSEVHLGEWEGGAFRKHVSEGHPLAQRMFAEERWDVVPGAEPMQTFAARVRQAVEQIVAAHPDQRVAVFAHGGVIGQILSAASGATPFAFGQSDNGSISHVVVRGGSWTVRRFNDTAHLDARFSVVGEPLT
jgi:probable phosphoglycerate mutase